MKKPKVPTLPPPPNAPSSPVSAPTTGGNQQSITPTLLTAPGGTSRARTQQRTLLGGAG